MSAGGYMIDGKRVDCWLFGRKVRLPNGHETVQCVQVEGFNLDHAWRRLLEHPRFGAAGPRDWEMLDKLEPEHDCGYLGEKLPLLAVMAGARSLTRH